MNTVRDRRKALMEPQLLADGIMKKPGVDTLTVERCVGISALPWRLLQTGGGQKNILK